MKFGVLGLGSIGRRHAKNLLYLGKEVAAYDPSDHSCNYAKDSKIKLTDRQSILESCDAIVIASPTECHLNDLGDAIEYGNHCFVEKPLAHDLRRAQKLLKIADKNNLKVFAGLNLRFNPVVIKAKDLLKDSKIGKINWAIFQSSHYLPNWRPNQDYKKGYAAKLKTGGVIFDIIHEFDLSYFLLGPATVKFATARNSGQLEVPSEDCADIILEHYTGFISSIHLDYITMPTRRWFSIGGERGVIDGDIVKRRIKIVDSDEKTLVEESFSNTTDDDDYMNEIKSFVNSVETSSEPQISGHSALASLEQAISARRISGLL